MRIHQDWLIRQIQLLLHFIARVIFKKEYIVYTVEDSEATTETDLLYASLMALLKDSDIGGAEDLLFHNFEKDNLRYLELAVDFYQRLNKLSDEELKAGNFSREEIQEGLKDILVQAGIIIPLALDN